MRNWALLACVLLAACATPQQRVAPPQFLFNDSAFSAPSERISADDVFALNDQMKRYLRTSIASQLQLMGMQQGLISALYQKDQLKLQYDVSMTRNASQAFDARAGNCLSLVIMTAAFAKELGLAGQVSKRLSRRDLGSQRRPSRAQRSRQHHARQENGRPDHDRTEQLVDD